jgi:maltokinase
VSDHDQPEADRRAAGAPADEGTGVAPRRPLSPDELAATLTPLLADYLPRQRWFSSEDAPTAVAIRWLEIRRPQPLLAWMVVDVSAEGPEGTHVAAYQLVVGGRSSAEPPDFLLGKERVTLGEVDGIVYYDALVDPDLALDVLGVVAPDEPAGVARPLVVEQSNSSVVYDERLILKLFRRLHDEPNPDVEVNRVLGERGFPHVVPQRAELRRDGIDMAVVRDYLLASNDAWELAHTSLRDLLASRLPPDEAGADFGPEAFTLGSVTAALHVALAEAFGTSPAHPDLWLADMHVQLGRAPAEILPDLATIGAAYDRLMAVDDAGAAIRIHGDLHLGQFLRGDSGWYVLDFEGEPARPMSERIRPSSPLRDVAGMLRSFHYAAEATLAERRRDVDTELAKLAVSWEERAAEAYLTAYRQHPGTADLLPASPDVQRALTMAFELDKSVYQSGYDHDHRPSWAPIPVSAVELLLDQVA